MRFTQVKLASSDPRRLALFYEEALDCRVRLPLTKLGDPAWSAVGAPSDEVSIIVLELPHVEGIALELIAGSGVDSGGGLLAFEVEDVDEAAARVISAGGAYRGVPGEFLAPSGNNVRFVFMTDPEGNVIDLYSRVG